MGRFVYLNQLITLSVIPLSSNYYIVYINYYFYHLYINAHRRGEGGRERVKIGPPQANFKILVNKNAMKPKIGEPPSNFS